MAKSVLVMDCEEQGTFWMTLKSDFKIDFCPTAEDGLEILSDNTGLVFLNQKLADLDGMQMLRLIKKSYPWIPVIMITFCGTVDTCVEAFRKGARDYLRRPLNAEEVVEKMNILMHINDASQRRKHVSLTMKNIDDERYANIPSHLLNGVLKVRDFITENYSESLTLNDACKMASVSKTYFCRIFKRVTDHTLRSYFHSVRMAVAEELLMDKRLSVTDVAQRLGYNDSNYFSTVYKKINGVSPRQHTADQHVVKSQERTEQNLMFDPTAFSRR